MNISLIIKTALKDSRRDRGKLFLFMSSIILGVASLVAINSFNDNLVSDINDQSKSLLGADVKIESRNEFTEDIVNIVDSSYVEKSIKKELLSMSFIPKSDESQFVRLTGISGNFPFYGTLETVPKSAAADFRNGKGILVDDGMMLQYHLEVGDTLALGQKTFTIAGRLLTAFGNVDLGGSFAPSVYMSLDDFDKTNLVQPGSFVEHTLLAKQRKNLDVEAWKVAYQKQFRTLDLRINTVEDQKEDLERAFSSLNTFLNIVALISLLLACIGVASSVLIYIKSKIQNIAILRCLGMKGRDSFMVYFIQIFFLALISVIIGAVLGSALQFLLPLVLKELLPFEVNVSISWFAIISGIIMGLLITILFALVPLLNIRNITPLQALRVNNDVAKRDGWAYVIYAMIFVVIAGYFYILIGSIMDSLFFSVGLLAAFLLLYGVSKLVVFMIRKFFPSNATFVVRQGLSNLYRPNNQTQTLIISLGLGTAILTLLFILQSLILSNVEGMGSGNQPNMILFGIETDQKNELEDITNSFDLPILQHVPVVTMSVEKIKGKTKKEWAADTTFQHRIARAMSRESRVSYQSTMPTTDILLEGEYRGVYEQGEEIYVSIAQRYADQLHVTVGDDIEWNVQGALIKTKVGSIRKIEFDKLESRFFILFPVGVLEKAPQFSILVTKSPDKNTTAKYRTSVVKAMPNVSVIDLANILKTLNDIISKVSYVIQFMAIFSILIGILVLLSSLFLSKYQRIRETVLLRTLGASRKKILWINAIEYASLGFFSAVTGIGIAVVGSYLITRFAIDIDFSIDFIPLILILIFTVIMTLMIGLWNTRDVIKKSPLEILRNV